MAAPEPEQTPAPAMEVPEGPDVPLAMSEPLQYIITDLKPCQGIQEPPAPLAAPEPTEAAALAMDIPERLMMPPVISELASDTLTALPPCQGP